MAAAKKPKAVAEAAAKPPEKRSGRPAYEPTPDDRTKVERMAGIGMKQDAIALVMGMSDVSLRKHFEPELAAGAGKIEYEVANKQIERALSDDTVGERAAEFLLTSKFGWNAKSTVVVEPGDALTELLGAIDGRTRSLGKKD